MIARDEEKTSNIDMHIPSDPHIRFSVYPSQIDVTRGREDVTWRMRNVLAYSGRAILVIRDPFRAIVSYWNHIVTKTRLECSKQLLQEVRSDLFNRFFINEIA